MFQHTGSYYISVRQMISIIKTCTTYYNNINVFIAGLVNRLLSLKFIKNILTKCPLSYLVKTII